MPNDAMLMGYAQAAALRLVYNLARFDADTELYDEPLRILQQAKDDLAAGKDPLDRLENVDGRIYEL